MAVFRRFEDMYMYSRSDGRNEKKSKVRARLLLGALFVCLLCVMTGCGKNKAAHTPTPNDKVTYEKGSDLTGVVKEVDTGSGSVTFYNPVLESEETFLYDSATSIQTKNGAEMSMDQVSPGEVYDLYLETAGSSNLSQMKANADVIEEESASVIVDVDSHRMKVDGADYDYSEHMISLSGGEPIDPMEITEMDRVTFRGVQGKALSVVVTRGHGYIEPTEYKDFIGGTLTIEGESILPVTDGMLLTVPEGDQTISMKNGDLMSKTKLQVKRGKVAKASMKESMTQVPNTARVTFRIHPEGAELYINGTMVDYSKPVSMYYGVHSIKVVLEGYNPYQGNIRIGDPDPTFRIDLSEEVATVEDSGDDTATDGEGSDDGTGDEGSDGESSEVTPDDGTQPNPSTAEYDVEHVIKVTEPEGASVYINGAYRGVAPCSFTKCVGKITLTLQKDGYETKSYTMEIIDDSLDTTLSFPALEAEGVG